MNDWLADWPTGGSARLMWDAAWQSSVVGLIAWLAVRGLVRQPAARAWVLLLALAASVAIPLASAAVRAGEWGLLAARQPPAGVNFTTYVFDGAGQRFRVRPVDRNLQVTTVPFDMGGPPVEWPLYVGIAWGSLSLVLALRLALSGIGLWRLCRAAEVCRDDRVLAEVARAAQRVGLARPPATRITEPIRSPAVLALGRARLLLPKGALQRVYAEGRGRTEWWGVLCHELAHVRRGDGWGRLIGELTAIVLPWQPLVWLLRRDYYLACDEACDDWAVASGANPVDLADTLTSWSARQFNRLALCATSRSTVKQRVTRLLSLRGEPRPRLGRAWAWGGAGLGVVLSAMVAMAQVTEGPEGEPIARQEYRSVAANTSGGTSTAARAGKRAKYQPYVIEPPDILLINALKLVPKAPYKIERLDALQIEVLGTLEHKPIHGQYSVTPEGAVELRTPYGKVPVAGLTVDEATEAIDKHLRTILKNPEVSVSVARTTALQQIAGEHLVGPDGTVNLGTYGTVFVSGKTIAEATRAIEDHLKQTLEEPKVAVDVFAYNSKVYYVVILNPEVGDSVTRVPITGNESVLDAIAQVSRLGELRILPQTKIWIAPAAAPGATAETLNVDWKAMTQQADMTTNYDIVPGDRIFISGAGVKRAAASTDDSPPRPKPESVDPAETAPLIPRSVKPIPNANRPVEPIPPADVESPE